MPHTVTSPVTCVLACMGGRTWAEARGPQADDLGGTAAAGAAMLVAWWPGTLAVATALRDTTLSALAAPLSAVVMTGSLVLWRQLARSNEVTAGLRRVAGRALAAGTLLGLGLLGAAELPELMFAAQLAEQVRQAEKALSDAGRDADATDLQLRADLALRQKELLERQADVAQADGRVKRPSAKLHRAQAASARCWERLRSARSAAWPDETAAHRRRRQELHSAQASACAETAAVADSLAAREAAAGRRAVDLRNQVATARAGVARAEAALHDHQKQDRLVKPEVAPTCAHPIPSCKVRAAVESGHLSAWRAWAASVIFGLLIATPALLREVLVPDGVARHRKTLAMIDRMESRRWATEVRQRDAA